LEREITPRSAKAHESCRRRRRDREPRSPFGGFLPCHAGRYPPSSGASRQGQFGVPSLGILQFSASQALHIHHQAARYQPAAPVGGCKELSVPFGTNLDDVGLASVDRNNKATLPRTAPSRAIKSSAKDLSLRIVKLPYDGEGLRLFRPRPRCHPSAIQGQRPIRIRLRCAGVRIIPFQHGF
jgi:hypothetical protein